MPAPKSVTKISKANGGTVEFTSSVDRAQYFTFELTRAALRDVGKFVRKMWSIVYYENFTKRSGDGGKATNYTVISSRSTKYPRVEVGLKSGKVDGFYAYFQEFGTSRTPRRGILQNLVKDNVDRIVEIESQYLSALESDDSEIEGLIDEDDMTEENE